MSEERAISDRTYNRRTVLRAVAATGAVVLGGASGVATAKEHSTGRRATAYTDFPVEEEDVLTVGDLYMEDVPFGCEGVNGKHEGDVYLVPAVNGEASPPNYSIALLSESVGVDPGDELEVVKTVLECSNGRATNKIQFTKA